MHSGLSKSSLGTKMHYDIHRTYRVDVGEREKRIRVMFESRKKKTEVT